MIHDGGVASPAPMGLTMGTGTGTPNGVDALAAEERMMPSVYATTSIIVNVHGLADEDVHRRRGLHPHSTHMRRRDDFFPRARDDESIEAHAEQIDFTFDFEGESVTLACKRNDNLITPDYVIYDGPTVRYGTERCYYACEGMGFRGGLSTCTNMHGTFETWDGDEIYITKLMETTTADEYHVFRKSNSPSDQKAQFEDPAHGGKGKGRGKGRGKGASSPPSPRRHLSVQRREETSKSNKYVGVFVGAGPGFIDYHDNRFNAPGAENMVLSIMNDVEIAYRADVFDYDLFVSVSTMELYRDFVQNCGSMGATPLPCSLTTFSEFRSGRYWNFLAGSGDDMLEHWGYYTANRPVQSNWDTAHFFGAYDIFADRRQGGTIGYAWVGTLCSPFRRQATGINEVLRDSDWAVVAHELGHNAGASHDSDGNSCDGSTYIMAAYSGTGMFPWGFWSPCSQEYFNSLMSQADCLNDNPFAAKYRKVAGAFGACRTSSGATRGCEFGTQVQTVECYDSNDNLAAPSNCDGLDDPPVASQPCILNNACMAVGGSERFDVCTGCGVGSQTEIPICINNMGGAVDARLCRGLDATGLRTRACSTRRDCRWRGSGVLGECAGACGRSLRTEGIKCVNQVTSADVGSELCVDQDKNELTLQTRECVSRETCEKRVGPFGPCDNTCGTGARTQTVECVDASTGALAANAALCALLVDPAVETEPCQDFSKCTTYSMVMVDPLPCAQTCASYTRSRVICQDDTTKEEVDMGNCAGQSAPQGPRTGWKCDKTNNLCEYKRVTVPGRCVAFSGRCGLGTRIELEHCIGTLNGKSFRTFEEKACQKSSAPVSIPTVPCFKAGSDCTCVDVDSKAFECLPANCGTCNEYGCYDEFCPQTCDTCQQQEKVCQDDPGFFVKGKSCAKFQKKLKDCAKCDKGVCPQDGCPLACKVC